MKLFKLNRCLASGAVENMAQDEKIFQEYLSDGIGVLRIYRWSGPAFTYGFSQDPQQQIDLDKCRRDGVGLARRITGGGVLFHQDEITYSFACQRSDVGQAAGELVNYRDLCKFLIRFYESLGLRPEFACKLNSFIRPRMAPDLCSASNEKYDLVIAGKKIGGNAQKRSREVIFQHGAIPCSIDWNFVRRYLRALPDDIAKCTTTLSEELKIVPDKDFLEERLIAAFAETFDLNFINYETCLVK